MYILAIQLQQQPHDCCPPEKGITYPEIIQNPSTISEQQSWQSTTIDPLLFHEDAFQRSMSTSSIIKHSSRKMSRKSSTTSTTSSRRSTISAPYTILQQPPFVQHHSFNQQQITELDSVITPSPPPNMGIEFPMTDPEELSFLLNNILMNSREDDMTKSTTSSHLPTTVTNTQGESVVITITPLSSSEMPVSRIVTCYCGNSCTCPGCFVHPNNNYDKLLAPTNKQTITTTSHYYYSSCSSDDEKIIY